mgnify:CR=1 FL=1
MQAIVSFYDAVLCVAILMVSCDYLRAVYFFDQPVISTACALTAIGAFGLVLWMLDGGHPPAWAVLLHTSIGIFVGYHYAIAIRREAQGIAHRVE